MKKKILFLSLILFLIPFVKVSAASVNYSSHVAFLGWQDYVSNDEMSGTQGQSLRLEGIKINLSDLEYSGNIEYSTHVAFIGWQDYVSNDELAGTTGQSLQLEAIKIRLTGELANHYDVCYKTHVAFEGWQDYVCNDEMSGTQGKSLRLEAINIKLVKKESVDPEPTPEPQKDVSISYASSVKDDGFQDYVSEGISGTTGQSKYIDRIKLKINGNISGDISYQTFNSNDGWSEYSNNDGISGKENVPIEAIKIKLTGEISEKYDLYYRTHVAFIGWMGWTKNDNPSGTTDLYRNVEALELKLLPKNSSDIDTSETSYIEGNTDISYTSHVPYVGWQDYVSEGISGTVGQGLRIEAVKIKLNSGISGNIKYQTYIARRGWSEESANDNISGTSGLSRPIEAIKIKLDGDIANYYDVYYRTHNSYVGWLSWAKNDEVSGSLNSNTQVEAMEIKLVRKTEKFDGDTSTPSVSGHWASDWKSYYDYFGNKVTGFRLIDGTKYYFNVEGTLYGSNVMKVVDVSSWQQYINWDLIKMADDVDGAIIRVGWGTTYADECGLDSQFDYNIQNLQRLGIPYDVYIYGYAEYESSAIKEAEFVLQNLRKYNVPKDTYIWYDAELDIPFNTYRTVIPIFVNYMKANGYNNVGVYSSVVRLDTTWGNLNDPTIRSYPIWVAQYYRKNQYDGEYKIWQFQSDGIVDGINGYVDVNMYKK